MALFALLHGARAGAQAPPPAAPHAPAPAAAHAPPAAPAEPLQFVVGGALVRDSNIFRLPDAVDPLAAGLPGRADTVRSGYVGLRVDKPYSLQRFQLEATKSAYRHESFTALDYDALNYRGAWLWTLTPRLTGTLAAERVEAAVSFADFEGTQRNLRKSDIATFAVDGLLFGGWHVLAGAAREKQRSSIPLPRFADYDATRAEAGLRFVARSGSWISVVQRANDGDYLGQPGALAVGDRFEERQTELAVSWLATGHSTLNGRLAWLERRHPGFPARDFSDAAGSLAHLWTPTGKLSIGLTAQRDIFASLDPLVLYTRRDSFYLAPVWQASAKLAARLQLGRIHTDFRPVPGASARDDDVDLVEIGLEWRPARGLALLASVRDEQRSSNQPGLEYGATISQIAASWTF